MAASKPTSLLSKGAYTLHPLALSGDFGTLTTGLGCSPFGTRAYPVSPAPDVLGVEGFRVGLETDPSRGLSL